MKPRRAGGVSPLFVASGGANRGLTSPAHRDTEGAHMAGGEDTLKGKLILGIDLGTTNSGVSVWNAERGRAEMLAGAAGETLTPSVVAWNAEGGAWLVG